MLHRIAQGRTDLVFEYVEAGGNPNATDEQGTPLIAWCAYFGDVSAVRWLLNQGVSSTLLGPNLGLNSAAFHGHWRLAQFLLERGADPNLAHPDTGETALHASLSVANRPANEMTARVLIESGANPNATTTTNAATGCFMRDVRTRAETALHRAAAFASVATIERLIVAGARREARDANGDTPLAWASWHQRPSCILRALTHPGASPLHPQAHWDGDHGNGWRGMDANLLGEPT